MPTIQDLRKQYPNAASSRTDLELLDWFSSKAGVGLPDAADFFGYKTNDPGFTTSLKGSTGGMIQSVGQLASDVIPGVGKDNFLERYGRDVRQRNPSDITSGESDNPLANLGTNLMERPANVVGQILGETVGYFVPGGVAKAGLAGVRALRGVQAAEAATGLAKAGNAAATAGYFGLPSYGQIREEQEKQGRNELSDILQAGGASLAVGAIESVAGPEAILARGGIKNMGTAGKTFLRSGLKQGAMEAGEELMQTPIETWAAGGDVFSRDTLNQALAGAGAGFIGGGVFGAAMHPLMKNAVVRQQMEQRDNVDVLNNPPSLETQQKEVLGLPNYSYLGTQPYTVFPDGSVATSPQQEVNARYGINTPTVTPVETQQSTTIVKPLSVDEAKTRKDIKLALDQEFAQGNITEEQHVDATNIVDTRGKWNLAKIKEEVRGVLTPQEQATPEADVTLSKATKAAGKMDLAAGAELPTIDRNATPEQVQAYQVKMKNLLGQALTGKQMEALRYTRGVRNMEDSGWEIDPESGEEMVPMSNAVVGNLTATSRQNTSKNANKGLERLYKRADELGVPREAAVRIMGLQGEQAIDTSTISEAQAAQAGLTYRGQQGGRVTANMPDMEEAPEYTGEATGLTGGESLLQAEGAQAALDTDLNQEGFVQEAPVAEEAAAPEDVTSDEEGAGYEQDFDLSSEDYENAKDVWEVLQQEFAREGEVVPDWDSVPDASFTRFTAIAKYELNNPRGRESVATMKTAQEEAVYGKPTQAGTIETPVAGGETKAEKRNVGNRKKAEPAAGREKRSETGAVETPADAMDMEVTIRDLFQSPAKFDALVTIVQSIDEIPQDVRAEANLSDSDTGTQGLSWKNRVYLIADNIEEGTELSVFLHELGVHVGMEKLLGEQNFASLAKQITNWSDRSDNSMETRVAKAAIARVNSAARAAEERGTPLEDADMLHETIAYFVEEAVNMGVDPVAVQSIKSTGIREWFRRFMAAMKIGLRKIGFGRFEDLTAQNIVDIAYGAADMELSGTFHGTAAQFRKFSHKYMGSGEGAQAFGWGTYLAQREGIANDYFRQDIRRKSNRATTWVNQNKESITKFANVIKNKYAGKIAEALSKEGAEPSQLKLAKVLSFLDMQRFNRNSYADFLQGISQEIANKYFTKSAFGVLVNSPNVWTEGSKTVTITPEMVVEAADKLLETKPIEGSLMSVRPLFNEDEMLDWDALLDDQPKVVRDAIAKLPEGIVDRADDFSGSGNATGEHLYRAIQDAADEGMFWDEAGVEDTGKRQDAQKVASMYLDSLGVKGIRFLDAISRDVKDPNRMTRNIVVFNDKNIARVTTRVGADESKIRFSVSPIEKTAKKISGYTAQLVDDMPKPVGDAARFAGDSVADMSKRSLWYSMFTNDLIDFASKYIPSARGWYDKMNAKSVDQIKHEAEVDRIAAMSDKLSRDQFTRTWQLILDMTSQQKWGYVPTWKPDAKTDVEMEARYRQLSDEEKAVMDEVFKYGDVTLKEIQQTLDDIATQEYKALLDNAKTEEDRATIMAQEAKYKKMFGKVLAKMDGPYSPMRRVGSHLVIGKSQRYIDAQQAGDTAELENIRTNPDHYWVEFVDSMAEAKRVAREMSGKYATVKASAKIDFNAGQGALPFQAFEQIRNMIREKEGDVATKLNNLVTELYLTSLVETSSRKSELRRENVKGLNADTTYKAFVSKGRADAHYIATLKNSAELAMAFSDMRKEAIDKGGDAADIFNELSKRYMNSIQYNPSPIVSKLMGFNTIWSLLTKPAYYLYNATQPVLMTQPFLSQKHGYAKSGKAMTQAYKDLAGVKSYFKDAMLNIDNMPEDVRRALRDLMDSGKLDITITQDLGTRIQAGQGAASRGLARVDRVLRTAAQKVETTNRLVTAIAAYRLAMATPNMSHENAVKYAAKAIDQTQGDYSNLNAPRLFNATSFQRLITQFRKFQLIQISFVVRMFKDAMVGATPAERTAARRALMYVLGHHAVLAGALGLPAANVIAWAFSATGGDDEPKDLELELRKAIDDPFMADLLTRGVPAALFNINVSQNVGMGQAFSLMPFTDVSFDRGGYGEALIGMSGPFIGGVGLQAWQAMGKFGQGDYYQGLEGVMPSGARFALRAMREGVQGVTNTRGDELVSPDEISLGATMAKILGFKTNDDANRQMIRGRLAEFEQFFEDRTSVLKKQYSKAYRDGDVDAMQDAREHWAEMNDAKRELGFKAQPLSNLLKAPTEERKRERMTVGGVQVTTSNRRFVQNLMSTTEE
jgi:hypothetical protein